MPSSRTWALLAPLFLLCVFTACDGNGESEDTTDGGSDTDTDSDSDSDTGSDGDADADADADADECDAPIGIFGWGAICDPNEVAPCPPNTYCVNFSSPPAGASAEWGFCSPECCNLNTPDSQYCTDVSPGEESCLLQGSVMNWCAIGCSNDGECPEGTACIESLAFCYPPAAAGDADADTDADTDTDTDVN